MSDAFRYYLRVRYAECDAQKVVFNSRYGDYLDISSVEFIRALKQDIEYQVVKQTSEWRASARYDNILELSVATKHLGNTSFTLATEIRRAGSDKVMFSAETVYVLVDSHTMEKRTIPADLRAALERGAPGVQIDHAGYLKG